MTSSYDSICPKCQELMECPKCHGVISILLPSRSRQLLLNVTETLLRSGYPHVRERRHAYHHVRNNLQCKMEEAEQLVDSTLDYHKDIAEWMTPGQELRISDANLTLRK